MFSCSLRPACADGPRLVRATLANGVTSIVCPRPSRGLAAVDVWVRAGSAVERPNEFGAAHFVEHLLFRGTSTRGPGEVDRAIELLGGLLNAGTTRDHAHMFAVLPAEAVPDALAVISDALLGSTMAAEHVNIERSVILDELAAARNDPARDAVESAFRAAWGDAPYGRPVLSLAGDIASLDRDRILGFYRRCYRPENVIVVVVGDVSPNATLEAAKRAFGSVPAADVAGSARDSQTQPEPGPACGPVRTSPRTGFPPEEIWAWRLGRRDSRDAFMAELLAAVIEEALASARSPQSAGETFAVARADAVPLAGGILLYVASPIGVAGKAVSSAVLDSVVRRLATDGPSEIELAVARRRVLGRSLFRQETCAGLARDLGLWAMLGDAEAPIEAGLRLQQIGRADLQAYASRWLGGIPTQEGKQPR